MTKHKDRRVGFHSIEMLLKLSPENIKKIFIPASRNDDRVQNLIALAESLSISIERKKNLRKNGIYPQTNLRFFYLEDLLIGKDKKSLLSH